MERKKRAILLWKSVAETKTVMKIKFSILNGNKRATLTRWAEQKKEPTDELLTCIDI